MVRRDGDNGARSAEIERPGPRLRIKPQGSADGRPIADHRRFDELLPRATTDSGSHRNVPKEVAAAKSPTPRRSERAARSTAAPPAAGRSTTAPAATTPPQGDPSPNLRLRPEGRQRSRQRRSDRRRLAPLGRVRRRRRLPRRPALRRGWGLLRVAPQPLRGALRRRRQQFRGRHRRRGSPLPHLSAADADPPTWGGEGRATRRVGGGAPITPPPARRVGVATAEPPWRRRGGVVVPTAVDRGRVRPASGGADRFSGTAGAGRYATALPRPASAPPSGRNGATRRPSCVGHPSGPTSSAPAPSAARVGGRSRRRSRDRTVGRMRRR